MKSADILQSPGIPSVSDMNAICRRHSKEAKRWIASLLPGYSDSLPTSFELQEEFFATDRGLRYAANMRSTEYVRETTAEHLISICGEVSRAELQDLRIAGVIPPGDMTEIVDPILRLKVVLALIEKERHRLSDENVNLESLKKGFGRISGLLSSAIGRIRGFSLASARMQTTAEIAAQYRVWGDAIAVIETLDSPYSAPTDEEDRVTCEVTKRGVDLLCERRDLLLEQADVNWMKIIGAIQDAEEINKRFGEPGRPQAWRLNDWFDTLQMNLPTAIDNVWTANALVRVLDERLAAAQTPAPTP